ncbi:polymer-forming cytoskeletal protein [Streptomyces sp. NPDC059788]|uniref:polymer-forming cytoskeletal protein n=1 Tax=Streptomyces sp. NPDC059788 TaxID=3346948 RepID=UPI00365D222F
MAFLAYNILTDPAPLQVSEAGGTSKGAVYIVVSNPKDKKFSWLSLKVRVPFGQQESALTSDPKAVTARVLPDPARTPDEEPLTDWDPTTGVFTVTPRLASPPALPTPTPLRESGSMILALEGFPVSSKPGPVLLQLTEAVQNGPWGEESPVTLSLMKQAPTAPRNFRPKHSLVAAGKDVALQWAGTDAFTYQIHGPDGPSKNPPQKAGTGWEWIPAAGEEPKRDATYTLTATSVPGQQQPEHILTTTVHLRSPEFESVTATNGLHTPWAKGTDQGKGRITFTAQGAQIRNDSNAPGTISAAEADVDSVTTTSVRGRGNDAGWVRFPPTGITVGHGGGSDLGTVTADKADLNGVNTAWVQGRNASDGWITFPQTGVHVFKDGKREWGTVDADKVDLNGVITKWVQGRGNSAGWIGFPDTGLNVYQGAGDHQWGTVAAAKADLDDLVTHRAQVKDRLTLQGGLTVDNVLETQDGPPRLVVHGRLDAEGEVNADGNVVAGRDLTVNGDLRPMRNLEVGGAVRAGDLTARGKLTTEDSQFPLIVHGESQFEGKVNANGHLSVRNGGDWIVHTKDDQVSVNGGLRVQEDSLFIGKVNANGRLAVRNGTDWLVHVNDDQVAIQGNLRVHGAFHSDS